VSRTRDACADFPTVNEILLMNVICLAFDPRQHTLPSHRNHLSSLIRGRRVLSTRHFENSRYEVHDGGKAMSDLVRKLSGDREG
jgi:hypothetical protein